MTLGFEVRAGEGRLLGRAAAVAVCAGAAGAMVVSAGDALFIARVGVRQLGTVIAASSAALVLTLGYIGALADRVDRGRLLAALAALAAACVGALALSFAVAPAVGASLVLILGKQLAAAIDLCFWVLIADRFDARQGRRLVPPLVSALGVGTVIGSFAVQPLASAIGARGVLACAAAMYAACAVASIALARGGDARAMPLRAPRRTLTWTGGWNAVRKSRLATHLAWTVAIAGVFAPILYYLLGAAAAAHYGEETAIAGFLGRYRGAVQVVILLAVLAAPWLLARIGVAPALLMAPLAAVAAAIALAVGGGLVVIAVAQAGVRLFDTAVETPAERLVQNLVPHRSRGRVQGFIDGLAKRAGAIVGGVLASTLVVWPSVLAAVTVCVALAWLALAYRLRRRFAALAVAELAARDAGGHDDDDDGADVTALVDPRSLSQLRADLHGGGDRRRLAVDLLLQLDRRGRVDAVAELVAAASRAGAGERTSLLAALDRLTQTRAINALSPANADALVRMLDEASGERAVLVAVLGRVTGESASRVQDSLADLASDGDDSTHSVAARLALARIRDDGFDELVDACLRSGDAGHYAAALSELRADLARALAEGATERALVRARRLLSALRGGVEERPQVAGLLALADVVRLRAASAEAILLCGEARAHATALCEDSEQTGAVRAAAIELIAALANADDAPLLARALGDADDDVRRAAALGLRGLGEDALEVLLVASSFGRRPARNAALEIARDLRITSSTLDDLIERELAEVEHTTARLAPLARLGGADAVVRRLEERIREAAHTLFLSLEARLGQPIIGQAARQFLRARDPVSRARALEALDTVLPRTLARRVLAPLDAGTLAERSRRAAERLGHEPLDLDAAIDAELEGSDLLARALIVHALGAGGRAQYREAITAAAMRAADEFDPIDLFRRLAGDAEPPAHTADDEEDEMPRNVETIMTLSQLPIFSELTTRQLAELAEVVRWDVARAGRVVIEEGDHGDALYFVQSGSARVWVREAGGERELATLTAGDVFGEMALFEGDPRSASVTTTARTRLGRIDRVDFEELVEEVPGIALAICRVLSRRVRHGNLRAA